ncbi:hypothetical protein CPB83DRAFT_779012 [Crepidotus variabilis]|uniref:CxC2-like cysteine cluster KDZ transposase-associated domain-containing protein n=1 Tax=Crepidotus variabilis TaxID=179855 RepID=A0A9P6E2H5_9AGAR|nr:hypothetical protein CPB83DRAFT_779012 [Crepidotus variabilis]
MEDDPADNDEGWEDDDGDEGVNKQRFSPLEDGFGNKFVNVIDIAGLVPLPMVCCQCNGGGIVNQLLDRRLLPVSFKSPRTMFTFRLLKDFRLSNLEAKTTGYQYYQKLRRVTNPAFPHLVPNRYPELRRASRMWRNLMQLRWNGFGYSARHREADEGQTMLIPGPGELAMFCAACPQPGINLPDNWETRYTKNEVMRTLVVDGNFSADHLRQKQADLDVFLSEGQGMMTARHPYKDHLAVARDEMEVLY